MTAIQTISLTKQYKDLTAVNSLDLEIAQGELFALLGVNGAGKTTTVKMLSCLTRPTSGEAYIMGKSLLADTAGVKALIGLSPQETAVAPSLTAGENLSLMCGVYGLGRERAQTVMEDLRERFSLGQVWKRRAGKLSGGWQRRLSIAMALTGSPAVLFLDEPTLGLDVLAREELWENILALRGKVTVILTTHYMEEAQALSDRMGVMAGGRLLTAGSPDELKARTGTDTLEQAFVRIVKGQSQEKG